MNRFEAAISPLTAIADEFIRDTTHADIVSADDRAHAVLDIVQEHERSQHTEFCPVIAEETLLESLDRSEQAREAAWLAGDGFDY